MKIGIVGLSMYPRWLNPACALHTFAFQHFLNDNNIENEIIDFTTVGFDNFDMEHPADYYRKIYQKERDAKAYTKEEQSAKLNKLETIQKSIDMWDDIYVERERRWHKYQEFINKYYVKSSERYDSDLLEVKDSGYDCYMCVTDIIWKTLPKYLYERAFFLGSKTMEGKPKISYAASRGVPKSYTTEEKELFFHYINDIDSISVREKSTKEFIEENSDKKVSIVLDPVLLHDRKFWNNYSVKPKEQRYVLLYYVMGSAIDTRDYAIQYAKENNLLLIELSDRPIKEGWVQESSIVHLNKYDYSVEEWLGYIQHAECIFTNSFHCCCFSIIFKKLFYVGKRKGDKVTNILEMFDLQSLRLANIKKKPQRSLVNKIRYKINKIIKPKNINSIFDYMPQHINYRKVHNKLKQMRKASKKFVLTAVSEAENNIKKNISKDTSINEMYRRNLSFPIYYRSGNSSAVCNNMLLETGEQIRILDSGIIEYFDSRLLYKNDETYRFKRNIFEVESRKFQGWKISFKIDNRWFKWMEDGSIIPSEETCDAKKQKVFWDEAIIPHIPVNKVGLVIAEAKWV